MTQLTKLAVVELPEGKQAVERLERHIVDMIIDGEVDPLEADIKLAGMQKAIDAVRKNLHVKHAVMEIASRYPEKTFEIYGAQITKKLTPARYDYSASDDPVWKSLNDQVAELTERRKQREKMLQTLTSPLTIADDDTGDMTTVHPPAKEQGETLSIRFV